MGYFIKVYKKINRHNGFNKLISNRFKKGKDHTKIILKMRR